MPSIVALSALALAALLAQRAQEPAVADPAAAHAAFAASRAADAARIAAHAQASEDAYAILAHLCDVIGPRLSGSQNLERAIEWTAALGEQRGLRVRKEPVMVPVWIRGAAQLELLQPSSGELPVLALGGSVATPAAGIEAEVLVVEDFAELERRTKEARGRIVLFDVPMPELESYYAGYGVGATYRSRGPSEAARHGALACLVRSVTTRSLGTPHTGATSYREELPKIPAAALATEDAARFRRLDRRGIAPRVRLVLGCRTEADAPSANVVLDLVGRERPEEIVLLAAHLDSWDVGTGALDDGGGCAAILAVPRILQELQLLPHDPDRPLHQRRERPPRRAGLPRSAPRRARATRRGARDRLGRLSTQRLSRDGERGGPRPPAGALPPARAARRRHLRPRRRWRRHRPPEGGLGPAARLQQRRAAILRRAPHARRHARQGRARGAGPAHRRDRDPRLGAGRLRLASGRSPPLKRARAAGRYRKQGSRTSGPSPPPIAAPAAALRCPRSPT
jgi:hypothetical protein